MTALAAIADLQDLDTRLDQLRHRRQHVAERAELADLAARARALEARHAELSGRRDELARDQRRLEDEVARVEEKASRENDRLYGGSVTAPRELEALQAEIVSLSARQRVLEDRILDVMEQVEPLDAQLQAWDQERQHLLDQARKVQDRLTVTEAEIDAETDRVAAERGALAAIVDAGLLAEYEARRKRTGGVVVGRLRSGTTCSACSLGLSAVDIDRIKNLDSDELVDCPECGVILVR